ncbi:translation elongation factor Ts [Candidatus Calescamantes bacterium]|nr:translation elongation factor Ts [Candidatus Calescamantes bacterium]
MSELQDKIRKLRKLTSAGIMDCKKALEAAEHDMDEAVNILRKKGIAKAEKKSDRDTKEGVVASYIHFNKRMGVLVEVLCETDFVSRTEEFQKFADEIALHIAAIEPKFVSREDLDEEFINNEKDIFTGQIEGKPADVVEKIVDGKLKKLYSQICLMDQSYFRDDKKSVSDFLKEHIAKFGENIKISQFVMFEIK